MSEMTNADIETSLKIISLIAESAEVLHTLVYRLYMPGSKTNYSAIEELVAKEQYARLIMLMKKLETDKGLQMLKDD